MNSAFQNPFKPGAGHHPPFLAGRDKETNEFKKLLKQNVILENLILTGLRGVGKTVLLDTLKPIAMQDNWLWVGTDLSESVSISEQNLAIRICTDLSVITSGIPIQKKESIGFLKEHNTETTTLTYNVLISLYENTPGLPQDKLKYILELAWQNIRTINPNFKGIIFAYDEAQNLTDNAKKEQFPLSLILEVFQSLQRKNYPIMLILTGLQTLFPNLVEARTYSERMFHTIFLDGLNREDSKKAILKPVEDANCPVKLGSPSVDLICDISGGYPYFIQFICREVYDSFLQKIVAGENASVPVNEIVRKLDEDFFAGRWARVTDRQRELLLVISNLENSNDEFTVQDIKSLADEILENKFSSSSINQMLTTLSKTGLIFKNRHGKYSFAVPLFSQFISRQMENK